MRLAVQVTPNARKTEVVGVLEGDDGAVLKIKLQAQPVEGQANAVLVKWLAKTLGVARGAVVISHGLTSRSKLVEVKGVDVDAVTAVLAPPASPAPP